MGRKQDDVGAPLRGRGFREPSPQAVLAVPASIPSRAKQPSLYIVFCPDGPSPPVKIHNSHPEASAAAWQMANRYPGKTFYIMKRNGRGLSVEAKETDMNDLRNTELRSEALRLAVNGSFGDSDPVSITKRAEAFFQFLVSKPSPPEQKDT